MHSFDSFDPVVERVQSSFVIGVGHIPCPCHLAWEVNMSVRPLSQRSASQVEMCGNALFYMKFMKSRSGVAVGRTRSFGVIADISYIQPYG